MGKTVCVYCASSSTVLEVYHRSARELGAALAERGYALVFGGGGIGLMGVLARTILDAGGRVIGVIPEMLRDRELALETVTELIVTRDMHERKAVMFARGDGFIALPGGFGTWEEIIETITLRLLRVHQKPCVILNVNGYYDPLLKQIEKARLEGFVKEKHLENFLVAETTTQALDLLEAAWRALKPTAEPPEAFPECGDPADAV